MFGAVFCSLIDVAPSIDLHDADLVAFPNIDYSMPPDTEAIHILDDLPF